MGREICPIALHNALKLSFKSCDFGIEGDVTVVKSAGESELIVNAEDGYIDTHVNSCDAEFDHTDDEFVLFCRKDDVEYKIKPSDERDKIMDISIDLIKNNRHHPLINVDL